MDNEKWLRVIKAKIESLPSGEQFEVKNLFDGIVWSNFSKGERISFGIFFSNEVKDGRVSNVMRIKRGKDNHRKYEKQ